jgi:hypothetical protein
MLFREEFLVLNFRYLSLMRANQDQGKLDQAIGCRYANS